MIVVASGTLARTICSSWMATASVRSMRVPTGMRALTETSPSSACGTSSLGIVGRMTNAAAVSPAAVRSTVGRCCSAR
jgi:hypothetical protein